MAKTRRIKKGMSRSRPKFRRKTVRGHRSSTSGHLLPPIDVREHRHIKELVKRITKGPMTIIMVYADWCGHCHTMMPHFDKASTSKDRTVQTAKINEQMLDSVNEYMNKNVKNAKPLSVNGYPSIILVNKNGNKVTDVEPVRDTTVMTNVMNKSGTLASQSGLNSGETGAINKLNTMESPIPEIKTSLNMTPNQNSVSRNSVSRNSMRMKQPSAKELEESSAPSPLNSFSPNEINKSPKISKNILEEAEDQTSLTSPVIPPSSETDIIRNKNMNSNKQGVIGGSLYGAISQSAYKLAPTAVLLSIAGTVLSKKDASKNHSNKKTKKIRFKRGRKTIRR